MEEIEQLKNGTINVRIRTVKEEDPTVHVQGKSEADVAILRCN